MTILALDPGLADLGWGIIVQSANGLSHVSHGAIKTKPTRGRTMTEDCAARCAEIVYHLRNLVKAYQPTTMAMESFVSFGRENRGRQGIIMGNVIGEIRNFARTAGLDLTEYPTQTVKTVVASSRKATKTMVQARVAWLLHMAKKPTPQHASDALAVAICHAAKGALNEAVKRTMKRGQTP